MNERRANKRRASHRCVPHSFLSRRMRICILVRLFDFDAQYHSANQTFWNYALLFANGMFVCFLFEAKQLACARGRLDFR